jgi:hypothetical protein
MDSPEILIPTLFVAVTGLTAAAGWLNIPLSTADAPGLRRQRDTLVRLRNEGRISNDVMHRIERELDLEESRLEI